jgi:hypothetical protein
LNAKRIVIFSVVGGLLIALLTGFVSNTPPMLVGAMWYGYPLAWLIRLVLAPEYFPWRVEVFGLVADTIIWCIVVGVVLSVSTRIWKK